MIPTDDTTLFVCSGMQNLKSRFRNPDGGVDGSLQTCIRTNDIELVGDGSHLTSFQMIGSFSFGRRDYDRSVEMWHRIVQRLQIPVTHVTIHPSRDDHHLLWETLGYQTRSDEDCVWSDGDIGGNCTELFVGELEIGNLVDTQGISTDVGFGYERILQILEGVQRIDETSLFEGSWHPIVRDHGRTLDRLWDQGVAPGTRGRSYVCRRLIRRMLPFLAGTETFSFAPWVNQERSLRELCLRRGRKLWQRHSHQNERWWWETVGLLPEEVNLLRNGYSPASNPDSPLRSS